MARRGQKKGRPVSGWLVLDKPYGMGSTEAVSKLKWLFGAQKAGHAGTLDPLASGMLPIAFGNATKTVPYVMDGAKIYRFTVTWGEQRTTDDLEGVVMHSSELRPTREAIEALLPKYTGVIMQTPPQFSAVKIGGERAYDLAREGETVEIAAREVEIVRFDLIDCPSADQTILEIECGKGTYVRSLARDMGNDLGCFGYISALRRTRVYPFEEAQMVDLKELEALVEKAEDPTVRFAAMDTYLLGTEAAMEDIPSVALNEDAAQRVRLGNPVIIRGRDAPFDTDEAWASSRGRLIAIGEIEQGMFKPKRVFAD